MVEGKCEVCNSDIDSKYKFCLKCAQEMKKTNQEVGAMKDGSSDEIVKALGAVNNNLYAIRTILEHKLLKENNATLSWDKEEKRFLIFPLKRKRKARK